MNQPTDPIRDPELTAEDRKWLAERLGSDHSIVTGLAERLHGRMKFDESFNDEEAEDRHAFRLAREQAEKQIGAFVAALEDSPTQPRYTVQEFTEKLLGEGVEAMARLEYEAFREEVARETTWEEETQGHRNIYLDAARERANAAIDAAFKSSTSTEKGRDDGG